MNVCEYDPAQNRYVVVGPTSPENAWHPPVRHQFYQMLRKARIYVRIQPDFDPFLDVGDEVDSGSIRRPLCRLFRDVWLGLKTVDKFDFRKDMLRYWTEVLNPPIDRVQLEYENQLIGGYNQPSRTFIFNIECAELALQNDQLSNLIAHELSHAWHDTQTNSNIRVNGPVGEGSEEEADNLASQWGYDMVALKNWRDDNAHQIGIFTGHIPRPIPVFDQSVLDTM